MEQVISNRPDSPVLVSACLLGLKTRWDGSNCRSEQALQAISGECAIPICPEQLGGLPTPRIPAEISRGDGYNVLDGQAMVIAKDGRDVTENYLRGAQQVLKLAEMFSAHRAILKEGSPSCGVCCIKRQGADVSGVGVTAALLERRGIAVEGIE